MVETCKLNGDRIKVVVDGRAPGVYMIGRKDTEDWVTSGRLLKQW